MQNESQNIEYKESWGRGFKKIAEEFERAWYAEHIEPNPREIGNGHYVFPETLGREKRVNSIVDS